MQPTPHNTTLLYISHSSQRSVVISSRQKDNSSKFNNFCKEDKISDALCVEAFLIILVQVSTA